MEEVNRNRIATVFTTDTHRQIRFGGPSALHTFGDNATHPVGVDGFERGNPEDSGFHVLREEHAFHVVTAESPSSLGQVVGAKAKELGFLGDGVSGHGGTRQLNHAAHRDIKGNAVFTLNLSNDLLGFITHQLELTNGTNQRNHNLRMRVQALLL